MPNSQYSYNSFGQLVISDQAITSSTNGGTNSVIVTPTISTTAYAAGQIIGTIQTLTNAVRPGARSGIIQSLILSDQSNQKAAIDVVFFSAPPTTQTDKSTFAPTNADLITIIDVVSIAAADYSSFSTNAIASKTGLGIAVTVSSGTSIYAALVSRGTPTYTSTSALQLTVTVLQD